MNRLIQTENPNEVNNTSFIEYMQFHITLRTANEKH